MKKQERGITLIALVVTIVVLLILAAVSISMLGGENGIITQAIQAKEQTIIGEEKEAISISYTACKTKDYSKDIISAGEMQTEIDKIKNNVQVTMSGNDLIVYFQDTEHFYSVNQNGQITAETGDPNRIVDMIDFNIGVTASGKVIYINDNMQRIAGQLSEISTEDYTIVTENGVRKVANQILIDNEGKVYTWEDINYGCSMPKCISNEENNLKDKKIVDIYTTTKYDGYDDRDTIFALDDEGKVYTWEDVDYGSIIPKCISNEENDLKGRKIVNIYITKYDGDTIFALDNEGKVYSWGTNYMGLLGDGIESEYRDTPICISNLENDLKGKKIVKIYLDENTAMALDNEGKVYSWGANYGGQLGDGVTEVGDEKYRNTPICISNLENDLKGKNIVEIYFDGYTVIALDNEGEVYSWGANYGGQLGDGIESEYRNTPICISDLENDLKGRKIAEIYLDEQFDECTIIALDNEGKVYSWGTNDAGQLGDGVTEVGYEKYRNTPICISNLENDLKGKNIVEIYYYSYSGTTIIAKDEEGKVYTWGSNMNGQLGDGIDEEYRNIPVCINSTKDDGQLKDKNIYKCCLHSYGYTYITQNGEIYDYYFETPT